MKRPFLPGSVLASEAAGRFAQLRRQTLLRPALPGCSVVGSVRWLRWRGASSPMVCPNPRSPRVFYRYEGSRPLDRRPEWFVESRAVRPCSVDMERSSGYDRTSSGPASREPLAAAPLCLVGAPPTGKLPDLKGAFVGVVPADYGAPQGAPSRAPQRAPWRAPSWIGALCWMRSGRSVRCRRLRRVGGLIGCGL